MSQGELEMFLAHCIDMLKLWLVMHFIKEFYVNP